MKVLACDPYIGREYADANGITMVDFPTVIRESDFLSLNVPLTDETRLFISADAMRNMKKGAIIVNTARGGLIDDEAAYELLTSGHLGGMGLDVYEIEPPKKSPLFALENVVLTPHTAAHTAEATAAMADLAVENLINVLSGRECKFTV